MDHHFRLLRYIQNSEAYEDQYSRILIEDDKIYFGHSLQEIKSSFPDLPRLIMTNFLKSFSKNNLWSYGHKSEDTRIEFLKPIQKQQEAIKQAEKLFFEPFKNSERLSEKNISKNLTDPLKFY